MTSTFTSATAFVFIESIWPLLPVSIVEMPSIWMFVLPPPPMRSAMPLYPAATPGVSIASAAGLRFEIGRFSTDAVGTVNERSPLDA